MRRGYRAGTCRDRWRPNLGGRGGGDCEGEVGRVLDVCGSVLFFFLVGFLGVGGGFGKLNVYC